MENIAAAMFDSAPSLPRLGGEPSSAGRSRDAVRFSRGADIIYDNRIKMILLISHNENARFYARVLK
jgi:hypothetical protein